MHFLLLAPIFCIRRKNIFSYNQKWLKEIQGRSLIFCLTLFFMPVSRLSSSGRISGIPYGLDNPRAHSGQNEFNLASEYISMSIEIGNEGSRNITFWCTPKPLTCAFGVSLHASTNLFGVVKNIMHAVTTLFSRASVSCCTVF